MNSFVTTAGVYRDGRYLEKHPRWHTEHSSWKAAQVIRMIERAELKRMAASVCEVGCGAGQVLRQIQKVLAPDCSLLGVDISPQAIAMCRQHGDPRLRFELIRDETEIPEGFDLLVAVDVIEHVEDYLGFLRCLRAKARYKIFHVPLDLSVQSVLRRSGLIERRESHAHLHYFTKDTFLRALADTGYEVKDVFYSKRSIEIGSGIAQRIVSLPRSAGFRINPDLTARVLGGFSLAVLAV